MNILLIIALILLSVTFGLLVGKRLYHPTDDEMIPIVGLMMVDKGTPDIPGGVYMQFRDKYDPMTFHDGQIVRVGVMIFDDAHIRNKNSNDNGINIQKGE